MNGDIYNYEGEEFILEGKYFDEYVEETGVDLEKEYSAKEATDIINSNVIAVYRGIFNCEESLKGKDICDVLSDIREQFDIRCHVEFGE